MIFVFLFLSSLYMTDWVHPHLDTWPKFVPECTSVEQAGPEAQRLAPKKGP